MRPLTYVCIAVALSAGLAGCADSGDGAQKASSSDVEVRELTWEELMPEGEVERLAQLYEDFYAELETTLPDGGASIDAIVEGSAADSMQQIGTFNVVTALDGLTVRLPGYVVPLDFDSERYDEFLLVPYFGACLHTPPPPPNQIVYVTADPAARIESIYEPVWVQGVLSATRHDTDTGNAAYTLALDGLERYDF